MSRRGTNIRKRADGRWEGRYYIVDTAGSKKCKSVYGHSYKEVTERLLSAKAASLNQTIAPKQSAITVKEVAEKWLKSIAWISIQWQLLRPMVQAAWMLILFLRIR